MDFFFFMLRIRFALLAAVCVFDNCTSLSTFPNRICNLIYTAHGQRTIVYFGAPIKNHKQTKCNKEFFKSSFHSNEVHIRIDLEEANPFLLKPPTQNKVIDKEIMGFTLLENSLSLPSSGSQYDKMQSEIMVCMAGSIAAKFMYCAQHTY